MFWLENHHSHLYNVFVVHSLVDGHLGGFSVMPIVNNITWIMEIRIVSHLTVSAEDTIVTSTESCP